VRLFRVPGERWFGNNAWLTSRPAARIFFVGAISVVLTAPVVLGRVDTAQMAFWERLPWAIVGTVGTVAFLALWEGMWFYWVRVDDSPAWAKRIWFVLLLIGFWYGSFFYFFMVYLPQTSRRRRVET
jgi:hypothetical protein